MDWTQHSLLFIIWPSLPFTHDSAVHVYAYSRGLDQFPVQSQLLTQILLIFILPSDAKDLSWQAPSTAGGIDKLQSDGYRARDLWREQRRGGRRRRGGGRRLCLPPLLAPQRLSTSTA